MPLPFKKIKNLAEMISVQDSDILIAEDTDTTRKLTIHQLVQYFKNHKDINSYFLHATERGKATQTNNTENKNYRLLLSSTDTNNTDTEAVKKSGNFLANPSTGSLYAKGFQRNDITGQTIDVNTLTLSNGSPNKMMYVNKTNGGANNITNIPVTGSPFILDVDIIRYSSASDFISRQVFVASSQSAYEYVRFCTSGTWTSWVKRLFTDTKYSDATASKSGLLSANDKKKLDGIAEGANKYVLPTATASVKGGVTVGKNISVKDGNISVTGQNIIDALGYTPGSGEGEYVTGTETISGITKLYGATGQNTDGAMTQKAVTSALGGKLATNGTAQKAKADASGNDIAASYGASLSVSGTNIVMKSKSGASLSTVGIPGSVEVHSSSEPANLEVNDYWLQAY